MRVQTEEWRRFIPGVRMYKGKKTLFYNGEMLYSGDDTFGDYYIYDEEERNTWEVIIVFPGVEAIPHWTFNFCKNLETIIMADTVKRIEESAFQECKRLKFVRLSRSIEYIGEYAFASCFKLTSIFIPRSCREIGDMAFSHCYELIILGLPQNVQLGEEVFDETAVRRQKIRSNPYVSRAKVDEWIKQRLDNYPLHKLCCGEHPTPELDSYNNISSWLQKDDCNLTAIDYFMANFGEDEHIAYLPEYVQYLMKNERLDELKNLSTEEILEKQCAWQQEQIKSLRDQVAAFKRERDDIMSVKLLEEEIKCCLCYNKFSTDINSTLPEIRRFLPVQSRAACPHYFCQGCIEQTQLAAAENAPQNKLPKWLKCMICKQKTAFCPEDPFYHLKLIELLERARRCHPIDVKVEEGQESTESVSKRQKMTNVVIKKEI
ncbi:hypothetical protein CTEN210_04326 [Chaetoceros tenuissimus]|uniref:RING-type domain-containing protein n=1 Tax=Chaetoceros tenuissimus TaxID=426638 RepID=A0AAD3CNA9_9STRA|nr:hypothetical protein CTEN210_04326 [Chaetoceros tenuissimus]